MNKSNIAPLRAWLVVVLGMGAVAQAQPLDLERALAIADEKAFGNQMAVAREQAASGQNLSAWAGFVPAVRLEAGAMVTDDPLGAFGSRLGQRRVSMASFDPSSLNDPDAIGSLSTSVIAEVPLLNIDAWHGKLAAERNLEAMTRSKDLERNRIRAQVVEAWFGVGLARMAANTWETGLVVAKSLRETSCFGPTQRDRDQVRRSAIARGSRFHRGQPCEGAHRRGAGREEVGTAPGRWPVARNRPGD